MIFVSDIGRPWTISEMETAFRFRRDGHELAYIAALLNRSVAEIRAVLE